MVKRPETVVVVEPVYRSISRGNDGLVPVHPYHLFGTETQLSVRIRHESEQRNMQAVLGSIVVSISACHAEDPGSIPGRGVSFYQFWPFSSHILPFFNKLKIITTHKHVFLFGSHVRSCDSHVMFKPL